MLVAATMRTLVLIGVRPPTVVYSPCCSTRSSRVCASIGMSPISSRNSVPPSACSKRPAERWLAPVKAPFSWPNSSLSMRSRGMAAILIGDEGALLALAVIVQGARDQFLAGAGFAGDHHREIGLHQPRQRAVDFLHGRRAADQRHALDVLGLGRAQPVLRLAHARGRRWREFLEVEGLRQIIVGAALGGLDRRHEGVLRAHDDDRQFRPRLFHARQKLEGVFVRHDHVGDDQIALARLHPAPQRGRRPGGAHLVAGARQRLTDHRANGRIVIGDENIAARHSDPSPPESTRRFRQRRVKFRLRANGHRAARYTGIRTRNTSFAADAICIR